MLNVYDLTAEESKVAKRIFKTVMKSHGIPPRQISLDVTMVTNEEIHELNMSTREVDRPTDVLSYPSEDIRFPFDIKAYRHSISPEDKTLYIGEIIVSRQIMLEQAEEYGHSIDRECGFLLTHGMLHLLGYDHMDEADNKVMRAKEDEILAKAKYFR